MLTINLGRMLMKRFVLIFFISPLNTSASTLDNLLQKNEHSEWNYFFISQPFNGRISQSSEEKVAKLFNGKKIVFNNDLLSITDACTYKYATQLNSPLSFWKSSKTVSFYKIFFSDYKIKIPDSFLNITPENPSEKCEFPFSDFLVLENEIVFFYENNAVFYFKSQEELKSHVKNIINVISERPTSSSKICKENEHHTDDYDTSYECFYKALSLIDTYREYRNELKEEDNKYLVDKIITNKDFSIKCDSDSGCLTVIYKWNGPDNLAITQQFDGGRTVISFSKEAQGCRVVTKLSPD